MGDWIWTYVFALYLSATRDRRPGSLPGAMRRRNEEP
jgi:hypothetical protein